VVIVPELPDTVTATVAKTRLREMFCHHKLPDR
jgi:hypothetical protein